MNGQRRREERGSIPMVLIAVIAVTGLVVVLVATANAGQRQARFDQGFEQALQVAEVGMDRLVYLAESGQLADSTGVEFTDVDTGVGVYTATAEPSGGRWTLTSTAVATDGTERTVTLSARPEPFFNIGFFADESLQSDGTNAFGVIGDDEFRRVVDGLAGTNLNVNLNGFPSMGLGDVVLADWDGNPNDTRCSYQGNPNPPCSDEDYFDHMDGPYDILEEPRNTIVEDVGDGCIPLPASVVTTLAAGDYCASTPLMFGNPFTVTGSGDVRLLVSGNGQITFGNTGGTREVNWGGQASQLQVYSTDAIRVEITSNTNAKALVYAPSAECFGLGNVEFHGALMCRTFDTGGQSEYYMPEDLMNVGLERFVTYDWREDAP